MDCLHFSDRIEALVDGAMPEDEQLRAAAHAAGCPDCRALLASMQGQRPAAGRGSRQPDRGDPHAHERFRDADRRGPFWPTRRGGTLDRLDRELLDTHVRHCPGCATLATSAGAAGRGPSGVCRSAAGSEPRGRRARPHPTSATAVDSHSGTGCGKRGLRLLTRPRVAWEAGYVAALAVWLICGASWSPLRATAVEAQALVERSAAGAQAAGVRSVRCARPYRHGAARRNRARRGRRRERSVRLALGPSLVVAPSGERGRRSSTGTGGSSCRPCGTATCSAASTRCTRSAGTAGAMLAELPFPPFSSSTTTEAAPSPAGRSRP